MIRTFSILSVSALALAACGPASEPADETETDTAMAEIAAAETAGDWPIHNDTSSGITEDDFAYRISTLADDRFGGRGPASEKGEPAAAWIAQEMENAGLQPAGVDGSWFQPVELIESTLDEASSSFEITINGEPMGLTSLEDVTYWTQNPEEAVSLEASDLVWVGYGTVAPEYGWNDYEGVDVEGKTVVMLINDPGFINQGEDFNGSAMTYYGRWTYKYEEAARQGAEGAIIIHQTDPASYPWGTVRASWSGPQFILAAGANNDFVDVQSWITEETAVTLFEAMGLDFEAEAARAASGEFTPVEMEGAQLSATLNNSLRELTSNNVAGMIEGAERPDEYVLFMAHWDHIGERLNFAGDDQIYNGAVDNATGTAAILEIAERFTGNAGAPARSLIFVAVTAEEQGLLGSEYYAIDPLVPHSQTVAGFNFDGMLPIGRTEDIVVIGYGSSELEDILREQAEDRGMYLTPDPNPEAGYYYRSDHVTLARRGVPMLYADSGSIHEEFGAEYGAQIEQGYRLERYHKPSDEYNEEWDLSGFVQSTRLMYDVASQLANSEDWPNWYEGNEFKSIRDASMAEE